MLASGIFNVKGNVSNEKWENYILAIIHDFDKLSKRGFAFNMLTSYSDREHMKENLYYADPFFYFDYCKRNISKEVSLIHDYGLYDFTILVRKKQPINKGGDSN